MGVETLLARWGAGTLGETLLEMGGRNLISITPSKTTIKILLSGEIRIASGGRGGEDYRWVGSIPQPLSLGDASPD